MKRLVLLIVVGLAVSTFAANQNRGQVFEALRRTQSNLDLMYANHQLTQAQYQQETERIRQFRLQTHVDAQQHDPVSDDERSNDLNIIQQIDQEISQMALTNGAVPATNLPVGTPLANLQQQYNDLNNQYQGLDTQYIAALSARDGSTAKSIRTQMKPLRKQLEDIRLRMEDQIR